MNNTNVIIIGVSHHNTYSIVRCFGEQGIKPILILYGNENSFVLRSRYISKSFVERNEIGALDLLKRKKEVWKDSLLISCTDAIASLLDINYDSLKDLYHFFHCGQAGKLTYYMNKLVQTQCAKGIGFEVPESIECYINEIKDCFIPYPRIIKPVESIHGGKKITMSHIESEFQNTISKFDKTDKVIVQQFIEKDFELVVIGLSYDGIVIIPGYVHKHRDEKGGTTYSTIKSADKLPAYVLELCKNLINSINYQGLFGIELIKQGDKFYFIEINLRNDATTYAIAKAGVNLPVALFLSIFEKKNINQIPTSIKEINSIVEFPDFIHVLRRNVSIFTWYRQLKNSECRYFFSEEDKEPYQIYKKEFMHFLIKRIFK